MTSVSIKKFIKNWGAFRYGLGVYPAVSRWVTICGRTGGYWVVVISSSIFISCANKNSTPEGILSKDDMAKTLTDFYLKESKINNLHVNSDSAQVLFEYYRNKYAEEVGIPDSVLNKSYQYYLERPKEMGEIYDRIIDSLALKEQRAKIPVKVAE